MRVRPALGSVLCGRQHGASAERERWPPCRGNGRRVVARATGSKTKAAELWTRPHKPQSDGSILSTCSVCGTVTWVAGPVGRCATHRRAASDVEARCRGSVRYRHRALTRPTRIPAKAAHLRTPLRPAAESETLHWSVITRLCPFVRPLFCRAPRASRAVGMEPGAEHLDFAAPFPCPGSVLWSPVAPESCLFLADPPSLVALHCRLQAHPDASLLQGLECRWSFASFPSVGSQPVQLTHLVRRLGRSNVPPSYRASQVSQATSSFSSLRGLNGTALGRPGRAR